MTRYEFNQLFHFTQETNPHFFKLILDSTLEHGSLRLPPAFVKDHGHNLTDTVHLQVPDTRIWKMEVKRQGAEVWLDKGLQEFIEYYSIEPGYFLMFKHEGGSFFHVFIFSFTCCEIKYPTTPSNTTYNVLLDQPETADQASGSTPNQRVFRDSDVKNKTNGVASVYKGRILQKTGLLKCENPHFIIYISPIYIKCKGFVHMPIRFFKTHLKDYEDGLNEMTVHRSDGETWRLHYEWNPNQQRPMITRGWKNLVVDNQLHVGDACAFELIDPSAKAYKLTIFRSS